MLEIKEALFSIKDDKAPGPDGYSSAFYKRHWSELGPDIIAAVLEFFHSGQLLKSFNTTAIALIPKTPNNPKVSDYRPIACCNVFYKIITKILSRRMDNLLPKLVNQAQSAFVPGRNIMDNIHLATELMRSYDRVRGVPRCAVKIDLRKAYDTISWDFLEDVLIGLNFHPIFVERIMECVTSPAYSIMINGSAHGFFQGKRGLRQGDPMSPSLFILCMEYLSRLLSVNTQGKGFNYHPKCAELRITHLAFADDLMLFGRGDNYTMQVLADVLADFSACSGLEVNQGKSNIFLAGTMGLSTRNHILSIFGFPIAQLPVKYLGIPLASRVLKTADYSNLIEKMANTVKKWNGKSLTYAGRLELIKSCLQGVEAYWLQAFPIPGTVISRIEAIARQFLWGSNHNKVAWTDICLPKEEGGLGLRDLNSWNTSLHSKILWNVHAKKDSLWIRWIHTEMIRGNDFWEWQPRGKTFSPLIKNVMAIRDKMLAKGTRQEVADLLTNWCHGDDTKAAYDWFRPREERRFWAKYVWKDFIPPKYSFIAWLALRGRLPTRDRITWDDECPVVCGLCSNEDEDVDHLFFKCRETWKVWDNVRNWIGLQRRPTTIKSAIKWLSRDRRASRIVHVAGQVALMATVYFVWLARNAHIKDGKHYDTSRVLFQIKTATYSILYNKFPHDQVTQHVPDA